MVTIDDQPWFMAKDVIEVLGIVNVTFAVAPLDEVEVKRLTRSIFGLTKGGTAVPVISESGLYKLIMRSDKPQAKPFQDWVTKVVLLAIRKDGAFHAWLLCVPRIGCPIDMRGCLECMGVVVGWPVKWSLEFIPTITIPISNNQSPLQGSPSGPLRLVVGWSLGVLGRLMAFCDPLQLFHRCVSRLGCPIEHPQLHAP